jgi:hypothetical protein
MGINKRDGENDIRHVGANMGAFFFNKRICTLHAWQGPNLGWDGGVALSCCAHNESNDHGGRSGDPALTALF